MSTISVIIPARNEVARLPRLVGHLRAMPGVLEVIVADGGSTDGTPLAAEAGGARVVSGARGRGPQQNLGAAAARGELLWFLHADAWPSRRAGAQIVRAARGGACGGNFRLRFAARGAAPRVFERIARWQRALGVYYGDSGLWLTRRGFEELGGFAPWPLFEDYDLARRLERYAVERGARTAVCAGPLWVSARRFQRRPWRTLGMWLGLQVRFWLGASPEKLAARYYGHDG